MTDPCYFALRLKGNALHFNTTLTVAQQQNFDQLVAAFRTTYTTNVEVLKPKLKTARQQPNQTIAAFLCDVRTLARRVYRGKALIEEQMVLTSFIESLHDAQLRWELRNSKPTSPDASLALAVELHAFMEMDPSLRSGSQATVNMVPTTSLQPLMTAASTSQEDVMGTLIQTFRQEIQKALPQTSQNSTNSRSSSTDGRSVRFISPGPNRQSVNTNQNQNYRNSNNNSNRYNNFNPNNRYKNRGNQQNNRYNNNRIHQTSNKTETTQINNHVDIVTEQITNLRIVTPVLFAGGWDICLANVEHNDKIKTIGNKIRIITKIFKITIKTATQIPHNRKIL